jgi:hypothetical protein
MFHRVLFAVLLAGPALTAAEPKAAPGKLPPLPGKAPVFAVVTRVNPSAGTFDFFLLFDEIVNTERFHLDDKGNTKKVSSDRVMTSRDEEKTNRPLKGSVVSTGDGRMIPMSEAMKGLPGKIVIFCDDFDGLHPAYRKMLAKDVWIIEIEKPGGLRKAEPSDGNK